MERKIEFRKSRVRNYRGYSSDSAYSEDEGFNETRDFSREYIREQSSAEPRSKNNENLLD